MDEHIAVMTWDRDGRVTKFQPYALASDAEAHVARFRGRFAGAFVAANPGGVDRDWRVDNGRLLHDPRPATAAPTGPTIEERLAALEDDVRALRQGR